MGLWEKFKSSFGGETTDAAQKIDPTRFYEGANTELKPKAHVEPVANVSAVESTDPEELFVIAKSYDQGTNGYAKDKTKAFKYYQKAADLNHMFACSYLASQHRHGLGTLVNTDKATEYFKKATLLGFNSYDQIADMYYEDFDKPSVADHYWKKYLEYFVENEYSGDLDDYLSGMDAYFDFIFVSKVGFNHKDILEPIIPYLITYYTKQANKYDHAGIIESSLKVVKLLEKHSGAKNRSSQNKKPIKVQNSNDSFLDNLSINDSNSETPEAQRLMMMGDLLYQGFDDTESNFYAAISCYQDAYKAGSVDACKKLGCMYKDGEGCDPDNEKSLEYFKAGAKLGDDECYAEMGNFFAGIEMNDNSLNCWMKYFEGNGFKKGLENRVSYSAKFFMNTIIYKIPVDPFIAQQAILIKDELIEYFDSFIPALIKNDASAELIDSVKIIRDVFVSQNPK